jgi:uncharacterized integral membrane protein
VAVFRLVAAVIVIFFLVFFGVRNMGEVTVDYLFGVTKLPLFLLMGLLVFFGVLVAGIVGLADRFRLMARMKDQARRIRELEQAAPGNQGKAPDTSGSGSGRPA